MAWMQYGLTLNVLNLVVKFQLLALCPVTLHTVANNKVSWLFTAVSPGIEEDLGL
jgi:hypothetical protein